MNIRFLGTGGAFDVALGNSAAVLDICGKRILVDCGHSVFPRLMQKGLADSIDAILITHLHDDHVGSLSTMLFYHNLILKKGRMPVIMPSLNFQLEVEQFLSHAMQRPQERMQFVPLSEFPEIQAIDTFGQHVEGMQTWGYAFRDGDEKVVYSGDNGNAAAVFDKLPELGMKGATVFHEVTFWPGISAHAYYKDLEQYLGAYEIFGYHCDAQYAPDDNRIRLVEQEPRFKV